MPARIASDGSAGVVRTFPVTTPPPDGSMKIKSVNVPPTSQPTIIICSLSPYHFTLCLHQQLQPAVVTTLHVFPSEAFGQIGISGLDRINDPIVLGGTAFRPARN